MMKVLILAYDFPPYVSVGGLRPYSWYKHLLEYGIEPVVITRQWDNKYGNHLDYISPGDSQKTIVEKTDFGTIVKTPFKPSVSNRLLLKYGEKKFRLLRKFLTAFDEFRQFLWISGPKRNIYKEADKVLENNKFDFVIATGEPFVLFYFAKKLSQKHSIPWIADYRDPWSQSKSRQVNALYHFWIKKIERKIVSKSIAIITVSDIIKAKLEELIDDKKIIVLPNGYNSEFITSSNESIHSNKQLVMTFVGTIYEWHPWKSVLGILDGFHDQILFQFIGTNIEPEINQFLNDKPNLTKIVKIIPKVKNEDAIKIMTQSDCLLLFNDYSILGTKIFDYLIANRKMILCYKNDEKSLLLKEKYYTLSEMNGVSNQLQEDLIMETNSGLVVDNELHFKQVINELIAEFKENGKIACSAIGVEKYSRRTQVEKLVEVLKSL